MQQTNTKKLVLSDFDGTLTTADTILLFIQFVNGKMSLWCSLLLFSPFLVLMKLGLYSNERMKERFISYHFKGISLNTFQEKCTLFAQKHAHIMRKQALPTLQSFIDEGAEVVIVSASVDLWVRSFFTSMPQITVLGTQLQVNNGIITGKLASKNCYGAEKVRRVKALYPTKTNHYIIAYGDTKGDDELLNYADEKHYKPFR